MKLTDKINMTLSNEDKSHISECEDMAKYLAFLRDHVFKVGDVLIKKKKYWDDKINGFIWKIPKVQVRGSMRKFIIVHVDSVGIPYIKKLSVKGHLLEGIKSLADVDFRTEIYEKDPDYAEAIILGKEDFDPIEYERDGKREFK